MLIKDERAKANFRLVRRMVLIALGMFGFGFAIAPYYDRVCEYFGISSKVRTEGIAETHYTIDSSRDIALGFITSVNGKMPLEFRAEEPKLHIHPGQYYTVRFFARNLSDKAVVGQAIPSIAPIWAAGSLKKTECFCFSEQVFEPHLEKEMPVRFVVDPDITGDVKDMTLSYTFFDITDQKKR